MSNVVALPLGKPVQPKTAFDDFWAVYPRKVAKLDAQRAWHKALKVASTKEIIEGAKRYALKAEMPYIAHPSTWLNQGRWMDEEVGAPAPMVTSELDRLRQLAARWFTGPMTAFKRDYINQHIAEADIRQMVAQGLLTEEEARR